MQQLALKASRLPSLFRSTSCTIDDILMDIASVFQIWSQLAGNEELVRGFELITNGEIFVQ